MGHTDITIFANITIIIYMSWYQRNTRGVYTCINDRYENSPILLEYQNFQKKKMTWNWIYLLSSAAIYSLIGV